MSLPRRNVKNVQSWNLENVCISYSPLYWFDAGLLVFKFNARFINLEFLFLEPDVLSQGLKSD